MNGVEERENELRHSSQQHPHEQYYYSTYGFTVVSHIPLPELIPIGACEQPDIEIVAGNVDQTLLNGRQVNRWLQMSEDQCQMWIEGIANYRVENGKRIVIDRRVKEPRASAASPSDVRVYLLGSALGVLAYQRGWLPLHINAVQAPSGALWAFTGPSGAGKSTLGAWLHTRLGWPQITDDVAVIKPEDQVPLLHAGPRKIKLWKETMEALQIDMEGAQRDLSRVDKFHITAPNNHEAPILAPLKHLVILERGATGSQPSLTEVFGDEAVVMLLDTLYRAEFGREFMAPETIVQMCERLAAKLHIYRFARPWGFDEMAENLTPILKKAKLS
ncbi:hypothetical protein [Vreelandella sp. V005]|uniref:hypothetical protein n=1 Tax=Vreelandella sp. V005 TaxID=3459608 RepID=UPI004043DFD8